MPGDAAAEKKFKDISEAYSVLSSPEDRQQYDAIRAMGGARFAPGAGAGRGGAGANGGFEDLFGGLFGGGPGARQLLAAAFLRSSPTCLAVVSGGAGQTGFQRAPQKGADRTATTSISFAGSIKGTTVSLRESNGNVIDVKIPAGIKDGQKVRQRGKGNVGPAGNGDLIITVSVKPHDFFQRDGDNIRIHVPVTFAEAALGATIEVPTLDGDTVKVRVPAGTPSGRTLRVKGRGCENIQGDWRPAGDHRRRGSPPKPEQGGGRSREGIRCRNHRREPASRSGREGPVVRRRSWPSTSTSRSLSSP